MSDLNISSSVPPTATPYKVPGQSNPSAGAAFAGSMLNVGLGLASGAGMGPLGGLGGDSTMAGLIAAQQRVQRETMAYSMHSNILKAHHDARMTAVRNMKS